MSSQLNFAAKLATIPAVWDSAGSPHCVGSANLLLQFTLCVCFDYSLDDCFPCEADARFLLDLHYYLSSIMQVISNSARLQLLVRAKSGNPLHSYGQPVQRWISCSAAWMRLAGA